MPKVTCSTCKHSKPECEFYTFHVKARGAVRRMAICKKCDAKRRKRWYHKRGGKTKQRLSHTRWYKNNQKHCSKYAIAQNVRREDALRKVADTHKNIPCLDCGKKFPSVCMDFDHLRDKIMSINRMCRQRVSIKKLLKEIKKCEVVCSNCHRIRSSRRGNWRNAPVV